MYFSLMYEILNFQKWNQAENSIKVYEKTESGCCLRFQRALFLANFGFYASIKLKGIHTFSFFTLTEKKSFSSAQENFTFYSNFK